MVSLGGIAAPLLVGAFAGTTLSWRFGFACGAAMVITSVLTLAAVPVPRPGTAAAGGPAAPLTSVHSRRPEPTLVVVFAVVALEFALSFWLASYLNDAVGLSRQLAVIMVSGLYGANFAGRLLASRLARRTKTQHLLLASIGIGLAGLPLLLVASNAALAAAGIAVTGAGIGATFPLTCSLHVATSSRRADSALGQVFATAAAGQVFGPLLVAAIAENAGLRAGLLTLPALGILAVAVAVAAAMAAAQRQTR
jgi:fucose permease